ncbi:MAG: type I polyketide synthase, partial [Cyanobacteria bacterium J06642_3]
MTTPKPNYKVLMQKALSEIKDLREQLQQEKNKDLEPIAIIGMGCRFPGDADTPAAFWDLLVNGVDAIAKVPDDRWNIEDYYDANPATPGKIYTRYGGFVKGLKEFDAEFFGIAPREANSLDPQQRLLLEVTWSALENAGVIPHTEKAQNTGVFVGISSSDYSQLLLERENTEIDAYLATGNSHSTAAGRISYLLGFTAPSMAVDTACSSSLVAVHLACKSLRDRECNIAVTGGVHRLIIPEFTINFSQARMLSADGRCKTFDAAADGFSRGEGCGMVVLKRLVDAQKDGDRILAVIKGSAVNQDGKSSGLTVPSGVSQQTVIRQALANSGVAAADIEYIETHGTGTSLGDPIEITALGEVFKRNSHNPLLIGSVKTNIGHLEAAAGIASLIKVVLSLQHNQIPPHLHFEQPNPYIDWDRVGVGVVAQGREWQQNKFRLAGISSFGFSGTNAHLVVEDLDISARVDQETRRRGDEEQKLHLLTLSAKSAPALKDLVRQYQQYLSPSASLQDICYTASVKRSHFEHRLAIITQDIAELKQQLARAFGDSPQQATSQNHKIAFLFTGQGSQYLDMGRELYQTQPVFRENCDRCFQLFDKYLDVSLKDIIFDEGRSEQDVTQPTPSDFDTPTINETQYTQPAIFTIEYALAQMWISWGIQPDVVMGHSIGEFVAATIAQVFSLEDAIKLVANRGKLMQGLTANGEMYVIQASEEEVNNVIKTLSGKIAIAAINTFENTVISGEIKAIDQAIAIFNDKKLKTTKLQVSHGFHSPLMESILPAFTKVAESINYSIPQIPFVSNLTGARIGEELAMPQYWIDHICQPVRFAAGMETLAKLKCNVFLEIGAKPILLGMGRSSIDSPLSRCDSGRGFLWLPSLRSGQSNWRSLLSTVASLYTNHINLDWASFYPNRGQILSLPTYPFQRQEYWLSGKKKYIVGANRESSGKRYPLGLQGHEIKLAKSNSRIWQNKISKHDPDYLTDHQVGQQVIFPSAGYLEMALNVGRQVFNSSDLKISNINFIQPLILSELVTELQLILDVETNNESPNFEVFSSNNSSDWINNSRGTISSGFKSDRVINLTQYQQEIKHKVALNKYYSDLAKRGLEYGASFRAIAQLYRGDNKALGKIELPQSLSQDTAKYIIHPVLLDACLQVAGAAIEDTDNSQTYLPVEIGSFIIQCDRIPQDVIWSYAEVVSSIAGIYTVNFELIDERSNSVATIEGLKIKSSSFPILNKNKRNL